MTGKCLIIIPTYNEKENIEQIIRYTLALNGSFDILVVDDGSPDGTQDIVLNLQEEYGQRLNMLCRNSKMGLGTAYIAGFRWALDRSYDYVCEMDADFSHNPDDVIRLVEACSQGAGISIGSRYISGITVINWPIGRVLISYFASRYVRFITGMPVQDPTAGFVCYRREVLEEMDLDRIKFKGYGFQIGMKFYVWKLGYKLSEIPILFVDRKLGVSKMSGGIFNEAALGVLKMAFNSRIYKKRKK